MCFVHVLYQQGFGRSEKTGGDFLSKNLLGSSYRKQTAFLVHIKIFLVHIKKHAEMQVEKKILTSTKLTTKLATGDELKLH